MKILNGLYGDIGRHVKAGWNFIKLPPALDCMCHAIRSLIGAPCIAMLARSPAGPPAALPQLCFRLVWDGCMQLVFGNALKPTRAWPFKRAFKLCSAHLLPALAFQDPPFHPPAASASARMKHGAFLLALLLVGLALASADPEMTAGE